MVFGPGSDAKSLVLHDPLPKNNLLAEDAWAARLQRMDLPALAQTGVGLQDSHGRRCHSTLPLTVIYCHCLGNHTAILLLLLSCSVKVTPPPMATRVK